jgi:hypothetical protein
METEGITQIQSALWKLSDSYRNWGIAWKLGTLHRYRAGCGNWVHHIETGGYFMETERVVETECIT